MGTILQEISREQGERSAVMPGERHSDMPIGRVNNALMPGERQSEQPIGRVSNAPKAR